LSARLWAAVPGDAGDRRAGTCVLQEQKLDSNTHRLPPRSQFCRQVRLVSHPTTLVFALPTGIEGSTLLKHVISASSLRDVFCVSRNRHSGGMRDLGESVKPSKPSNHTLPAVNSYIASPPQPSHFSPFRLSVVVSRGVSGISRASAIQVWPQRGGPRDQFGRLKLITRERRDCLSAHLRAHVKVAKICHLGVRKCHPPFFAVNDEGTV
jgi:hypothetical protein